MHLKCANHPILLSISRIFSCERNLKSFFFKRNNTANKEATIFDTCLMNGTFYTNYPSLFSKFKTTSYHWKYLLGKFRASLPSPKSIISEPVLEGHGLQLLCAHEYCMGALPASSGAPLHRENNGIERMEG